MAKKKAQLRILMAFSEVAPFAKTGGLADVGGALLMWVVRCLLL